MRTIAFIFVGLISWPAFAFDATEGDMSCTSWLQSRAKLESWAQSKDVPHGKMPTDHLAGSGYLIGFIEGYDWTCPLKRPRGSGIDTDAVFERADDICKSRDVETPLLMLAIELVKQLDPQHSEFCLPRTK